MAEPTAHEQLILELVNRARLDPPAEARRLGIDLNRGLAAGTLTGEQRHVLAFNPALGGAADAHSNWMLAQDVFSHTGSGGSDPGGRMAAAGYVFSGGWSWGENIAWSGTTGVVNVNAAAAQHHDNLFNSAGHRLNILEGDFREIGIGSIAGRFRYQGTDWNALMTAENFAYSGGGHFITGVVYSDTDANAFYSAGEGRAGVTAGFSLGASALGSAAGWVSGGYSFKTSATGTVGVTFSGGGLASPVSVSIALGDDNAKVDLAGANTILSSVTATLGPGAAHLTLLGLGAVNGTGTGGANTIAGNKGANVLGGGAGNDTLRGMDGHDRLQGGAGSDRLDGGSGSDTADYRGEAGIAVNLATGAKGGAAAGDSFVSIETIYGSNTGADSVTGGSAADKIHGWGGNDTLAGGTNGDRLLGGAGADTIDGGAGNDILTGGTEADAFVFAAAYGDDKIADFEDGLDRIRLAGTAANDLSDLTLAANGTAAVTVALGADSIVVCGSSAITLTAADFIFV